MNAGIIRHGRTNHLRALVMMDRSDAASLKARKSKDKDAVLLLNWEYYLRWRSKVNHHARQTNTRFNQSGKLTWAGQHGWMEQFRKVNKKKQTEQNTHKSSTPMNNEEKRNLNHRSAQTDGSTGR